MAMDTDIVFCIGTSLPRHHIDIGHHVQGHGHRQRPYHPVYKPTANPLDNKATVEPHRGDDKYQTQMDISIAVAVGNKFCSYCFSNSINTFSHTDTCGILCWSIHIIDT